MRNELLNAPIKQPAPRPPQKAAPAAIQPQDDNRSPANAQPRRNEPERIRLADSRLNQGRDTCRHLDADGVFFEQLLVSSGGSKGDQSGAGGGSGFNMFAPAEGVPTQLIDELALQLPAHGNRPFSATLLMPNLGKVQVRANKRDSRWAIELGFERSDVLERLSARHQACEDAFAQALGQDVELSMGGA
ncbi:type III secretion system HrpP C-terminal domain-containing protein [Pseudomonas brassicacearum]|uniref:type III secretion system HrpP C-terminal domain-containing protein n=1 Tax=Pseudomonas brassicacearum TaxID=930166 RepID=UPI0021821EDD|nr:type III secretion system HrpP C-terminal domain-containing protein [Pseudomonas brassicacearum]